MAGAPTRYPGTHYFQSLVCGAFTGPAGHVTDSHVAAGAGIAASKLEGEFSLTVSQNGAVAAATTYLRVIRGATGSVLDFQAAVTESIATGADRTVSVDLQKSTGGGAFATILSAALSFSDDDTLRQIKTATIASASLVEGDILRVVVTVAGAASAQAAGLVATVTINEDPN